MNATSPGVSQCPGFKSAERKAVVNVFISWMRTAAAPFMPRPADRIALAAARMSNANEMVVEWRSEAGPPRWISA